MGPPHESVGVVLDRISIGRAHRFLLLLVGVAWALAAMEVILISFVLPDLIEAWSLSGPAAGALGSATLLGMAIGSWFGGRYADRAGRVTALTGAVAVYSIATGVTALASGFFSMFTLRLVTGVGIGATATAGTTYLSEYLPTKDRGRYMVYFDAFWALGMIVAVGAGWAFLSPSVPSVHRLSGVADWRLLFVFAAFPVVLLPLLSRLDETPYYLVTTGRLADARDRLRDLGRSSGVDVEVESLDVEEVEADAANAEDDAGFRRLVRPDLARRALVISLAWFGVNFGYYGVFIWLPDTVDAAGVVGGTYTYLFLAAVIQVPGYLSAAALVDRIGRKLTLGLYLVFSGVATLVFASTLPSVDAVGIEGVGPFLVGLLAASFFAIGSFGAIRAYTPELFPTDVRSLGTGVAEGTGRIAGIAGPIVAGALVGEGYLVALAPLVAGFAVAGLSVLLVGPETRGRTLA